MSIRVAIRHTTEYRFDRTVTIAPHIIRLRPTAHSRTAVRAYSLKIEPADHRINWQEDPFGNYQARVVFPHRAETLKVDVELIAEIGAVNPFDFFIEPYAEHFPFAYPAALAQDLTPYLALEPQGAEMAALLRETGRGPQPLVQFLVGLNQHLQRDIHYRMREDAGVQGAEETLRLRSGSCRDSAWLLVQLLRHLGLAARFASGYLVQLAVDEQPLEGPPGPEKDFTDLHAWSEVFIPGAGWVGLDPTSGLLAGEAHIPLACTPSPESAAPITGTTEPCGVELHYRNHIERLRESPRPTRPYTEHQWLTIDALGERVEKQLQDMDVRLTVGGEPTFVAVDSRDAPEWNTEADGAEKRALGRALLSRLQRHYAPGGVRQFGLGKSYPGEDSPRWALGLFWRTDGEPLWRDQNYLADTQTETGQGAGYCNAGHRDAEQFLRALAEALQLEPQNVVPAYEDRTLLDWKLRQLPQGCDLAAMADSDQSEHRLLARLAAMDPDMPAGFVLPLAAHAPGGWYSGRWPLRGERLCLLLGPAPLGLRLPLATLPDRCATGGEKIPRTALTVDARDGRLHLFLPPLQNIENWIALIAAIEKVAVTLDLPVALEGYGPPRDPRLQRLLITPDPGVLEINVQPATGWRELVEQTETLFREARDLRLDTQKFLPDGREVGTGGGNHITLGGFTASDSPLLRRPDLLRSLITGWQRHPSLSYLFSSLFVGPTSQAPRVDEGRHESLYELEIAFGEMERGTVDSPKQLHRLLCHLLVDITGNCHRAELCVDKLYPPGKREGRLGILEFRGFEMPPHPRMLLVQHLLLRCLVACYWRNPLRGRLVRWGSQLHDRFMLPHFVWRDLLDLCGELDEQGCPFDPLWLRPFFERRFPVYGGVQYGDITLELRGALEPWNVLGEAVRSGAASRPVDSSTERLQVRLRGAVGERYVLACNGRRVPLHNTGRGDEWVAGVRFRACCLANALHPTIGVHTPLVFDLIDTWNGRAVAGCTYHVCYPSGREFAAPPVNGLEAEARRAQRFQGFGHSPGSFAADDFVPPLLRETVRRIQSHEHPPRPMAPPPVEPAGEYPYTLDLRSAP